MIIDNTFHSPDIAKSLSSLASIFLRCKRVTNRSSFCDDEKKIQERKLEADGWISFLEKRKGKR